MQQNITLIQDIIFQNLVIFAGGRGMLNIWSFARYRTYISKEFKMSRSMEQVVRQKVCPREKLFYGGSWKEIYRGNSNQLIRGYFWVLLLGINYYFLLIRKQRKYTSKNQIEIFTIMFINEA